MKYDLRNFLQIFLILTMMHLFNNLIRHPLYIISYDCLNVGDTTCADDCIYEVLKEKSLDNSRDK